MSRRTDRVSGLLREEISRLMTEELHDPRLHSLVTIAHAEITEDLRHARLAITVLGDEEQQRAALDALQAASGFLRRALGPLLKLKRTPEITFEFDRSIQEGDEVLTLLDRLAEEGTAANG